ncbi:MAG: hypothetical protein KDE56_20575 [Anaerolineales bacterium]|nr:hypothetical protein [Anaerolineales bacterium]
MTDYIQQPAKIRVWEPLLVVLLALAGIIYAINVFNTGDWLWFQSTALDAHPDRLRIRYYGNETFIQPGHDDYQALADVLDRAISDFNNTALIDVGFGDETLEYFDTQGVVLELFYDNPIEFHAPFRAGNPTQILIPIEGRHAGRNYFFRGDKGVWWFGAMRMSNSTELYATLEAMGYLQPQP